MSKRMTCLNYKTMKFIDLFAGIGGIRLGFEKSGGECVFSSEWDKNCVQSHTLMQRIPMKQFRIFFPLLQYKIIRRNSLQ